MKQKYYILVHIDTYEPSIYEFDDKNEALECYQEQIGLGNNPIMTKELKVITFIQDDEE